MLDLIVRRFRRHHLAVAGLAVLILLVLSAILAPAITMDPDALSVSERTRAERAALAEVGGGTVTELEASDDRGEAYEVEVRGTDGRFWDLKLDSDFQVVRKSLDDD